MIVIITWLLDMYLILFGLLILIHLKCLIDAVRRIDLNNSGIPCEEFKEAIETVRYFHNIDR